MHKTTLMSKGLGCRQREIMQALENSEIVVLSEMRPGIREYIATYGKGWLEKACSDEEALKRAARTLARRGLIKKARYSKNIAPYKNKRMLAYRLASWQPVRSWYQELLAVVAFGSVAEAKRIDQFCDA